MTGSAADHCDEPVTVAGRIGAHGCGVGFGSGFSKHSTLWGRV